MRTRSQELDDVKVEVASYVGFRARRGTNITFQEALLQHRDAIREAYRDDPENFRDRLSLLDDLCASEGVMPGAERRWQ